ncbi:NAD(P)-binding protein [Aspergillus keveii]|uniref:NAD(P)-binding protein n=1 Tax=Aspergillus keveii TaxID=714993 RepID=A0ABR4G2L7_9EURO
MVVVAVAGGTGGLGKTVVEQLRLHGSHHKCYVLGRKAPQHPTFDLAPFLEVDYGEVESLTKILEDHDIDTIISTINLETNAGSEAQLNLIAAASSSRVTRRIIPSEFVSVIDEDNSNSGPGIGGWIANARALKKSQLEYTRISIGFFSDYWGLPHIKTNLRPFHWFLDIDKGVAAIPGTGDEKFTVTYSKDLALIIVKLLDIGERWPERLCLSGSDISLNELVAHAEKIRGSKMSVVYDPVEKLDRGDVTLLWHPEDVSEDQFKPLFVGLCQLILAGDCLLPKDSDWLAAKFPDLQLTTAEEILDRAWKGRESAI